MNTHSPLNFERVRFLDEHTSAVTCAHPDKFNECVDPYDKHEDLPDWVNYKWDSDRNYNMLHEFRKSACTFEVALIDLFFKSSWNNKRKAIAAWPWLWMNRKDCVAVANKLWHGESTDVCERCNGRGWIPDGPDFDADSWPLNCPDCDTHDPDTRDR
jgi:hypothetical protein